MTHPTCSSCVFNRGGYCVKLQGNVEADFYCAYHPRASKRPLPEPHERPSGLPQGIEYKEVHLRDAEVARLRTGWRTPADVAYENAPEDAISAWEKRQEEEHEREEGLRPRIKAISARLGLREKDVEGAVFSLYTDEDREAYVGALENLAPRRPEPMPLDRSTMDEKAPPKLDGATYPQFKLPTPSWGLQEDDRLGRNLQAVRAEVERAMGMYAPMHSYAEGLEVIREELDELAKETRLKPKLRDKNAIREEAVQLTAMGLRFLHDLT